MRVFWLAVSFFLALCCAFMVNERGTLERARILFYDTKTHIAHYIIKKNISFEPSKKMTTTTMNNGATGGGKRGKSQQHHSKICFFFRKFTLESTHIFVSSPPIQHQRLSSLSFFSCVACTPHNFHLNTDLSGLLSLD